MKTIVIPQDNSTSFSSALCSVWLQDPAFHKQIARFVSAVRLRKVLEGKSAGLTVSVLDEDWTVLKSVVEAEKKADLIELGRAVLDAK